jgi:hypothetical protein
MNLNWVAAEILMKQGQMEIERSVREAWKWSDAMQKGGLSKAIKSYT